MFDQCSRMRSKTAIALEKKGIHRLTIDLPIALWKELEPTLRRRAERISYSSGGEVNPSFTSWLRQKADETIKAYK